MILNSMAKHRKDDDHFDNSNEIIMETNDLTAIALKRDNDDDENSKLLRIASYNIRVDHMDDNNTIHCWKERRKLVLSSIVSLKADIIALQEPSPFQEMYLKRGFLSLGVDYGCEIFPCDPPSSSQLLKNSNKPIIGGQELDGNGFCWRKDKYELLSLDHFHLPSPKYKRTCVVGKFRSIVLAQGLVVVVLSTHFDHEGKDDIGNSATSWYRRESARRVMKRAHIELQELSNNTNDTVVVFVCGDFNTFKDREGDCYKTLLKEGKGQQNTAFVDVRDLGIELNAGRDGCTWEGWRYNPWARCWLRDDSNNNEAAAKKNPCRFDQIFVSTTAKTKHLNKNQLNQKNAATVTVQRTFVPEQRFRDPLLLLSKSSNNNSNKIDSGDDSRDGDDKLEFLYASDHLPIIVDCEVTFT